MQKRSNSTQVKQPSNLCLQIDRIEEFELNKGQVAQIQRLLTLSFPDYPTNTSYYKQLPSFRYLTFNDNKLVGHLGVDLRMINNDGQLLKVLCISDVCVHEDFRDRQIASNMLKRLEADAAKKDIDFLILIANDSKVYYHHGYRSRENTFRWLFLQNDKSLGVVQRKLGKNVIMVKRLGEATWAPGITDLLGTIF